MKYILTVVTLCLFFDVYNVEAKMNIEAIKKVFKGLKGPCMQQTGATEEQLAATHRGEFERVPELMCFYKCLFQKTKGIQGGKLNVEAGKANLKAMVEPDLIAPLLEILEHCAPLADNEDLCQASFDYMECSYKYNPDLYFYP